MTTLSIIETAYRATLEEQDDPIIWVNQAMCGAGADINILLRGNAVNYATIGQVVEPLTIGDRQQHCSPHISDDVASLPGKGIIVYVVGEELSARGIDNGDLVEGMTIIAEADLPGLLNQHDRVWHW